MFKLRIVTAGLLLVVLMIPGTAQDTAKKKQESTKVDADEQAIIDNAAEFVKAFNNADAEKIASHFTENGEMSIDGETAATGRKAIAEAYAKVFKENKDMVISVHIDSIRKLGPNLIVEKGVSEIVNDEDDSIVDLYTAIHTKQNGKWLTASADVKQHVVDPEYDWKQELGFLVGNWKASKDDWSVETKFAWAAGGNFLRRDFKVTEGSEIKSSGVSVIGWDPINQSVTSWVFNSDGGNGRGSWSRESNQWVVKSETVTPDGDVIQATNIFTILSNDLFRWQSIDRSISGTSLDDTDSIRVERVNSKPSKE